MQLLATLHRRLSGYRRCIYVLRKSRLIRDNIACLETADFTHIGHNYLCAPLPVVPCQLLRYNAMYPNQSQVHYQDQSWIRLNATRNRRSSGALRPRERRFRLIFGGRESILIAVYEISFRPCSDADWSIGTRTGPAKGPDRISEE